MHRKTHVSVAGLAAALILAAGLARPACAQTTPIFPAPQAPLNVQAFPGQDKAVLVTWIAVPDAAVAGYDIFRRTPDQTADKAVKVNATPVTATSANDTGVTNGTGYLYFVKAVYKDSAGKLTDGPASADVPVTVSPAILGAFIPYTIDTLYPGSVSVDSSNVLTIRGTGVDLWDTHDGHTFLAAPVAGDFSITAKMMGPPVKETTDVQDFANVGIEIRAYPETFDPTGASGGRSQYALLKIHVVREPNFYFEGRTAQGSNFGGQDGSPAQADTKYPALIRLTRKGTVISAAFSEDNGTTWTALYQSQDYGSLPPVVYAGIEANGHTPGNFFVDGKFDLTALKITAAQ